MPDPDIRIAFRIPGVWKHPKELVEKLPEGYRTNGEELFLPDGSSIEFGAGQPDNQFAKLFRQSCRRPPTTEELGKVNNYQVNTFLYGPGGSQPAAHRMMQGAAALIRAGGAGVFIDNSGVAHGGENWLAMTEDGGPDALTFAFVAIVQGQHGIYTIGMHALGLRDILMNRIDVEKGGFDIVEVIRYVAASDRPIEDQHIIADLDGPRFKINIVEAEAMTQGSPMFNPYGRLKLVSYKDIAERN